MNRIVASLSVLLLALVTSAQAMLIQLAVDQPFPSAFATSEPRCASIIDADCGAGNYCRNNPIDNVDPLGLWSYWNPATWGVPNGGDVSVWHSLNPFDETAAWGATASGAGHGAGKVLLGLFFPAMAALIALM